MHTCPSHHFYLINSNDPDVLNTINHSGTSAPTRSPFFHAVHFLLTLFFLHFFLCHPPPLLSHPHFPSLHGGIESFVVCCLNRIVRNWLSSLSLKISPRANLLLVPRCHAGDEEVFIKPMQSDSFSNSLQCWGEGGWVGGVKWVVVTQRAAGRGIIRVLSFFFA